jgi:molybdopterin/thiamine biosynthesis adenylyltransferase
MLKRYQKNMGMLSEEEIQKINSASVCVIGCGGLGAPVVESLARLGFEKITAVDKAVFDETNYNRHIYANDRTMGMPKAVVVKKFLLRINSRVEINTMTLTYDERLGRKIIKGHDIVVAAVDNRETRMLLQKHCAELNVPLVHGNVDGWTGQMGICTPGTDCISTFYPEDDASKPKPQFTSVIIANMIVTEIAKYILNQDAVVNKLISIDLKNYKAEIKDQLDL